MAKGAISQVVSNLTKDDLINNRQGVGELLRKKLDNDLRDTYAICTGLQIIKFEFSKQVEDPMINIQVA